MSKISKPQKPFRVWFHYNKPTSRMMEMPVWTVHWRGTCYQVLNIQCNVDTETHGRNSQPHAVVRGFAHHVELRGPMPEKNCLYHTAHIDKFRDVDWKYHTTVQGSQGTVRYLVKQGGKRVLCWSAASGCLEPGQGAERYE